MASSIGQNEQRWVRLDERRRASVWCGAELEPRMRHAEVRLPTLCCVSSQSRPIPAVCAKHVNRRLRFCEGPAQSKGCSRRRVPLAALRLDIKIVM